MSHRAAGRERSSLPPAHARGMVSEASVAHFGYLSRYTIPPARAEEGPPGPGRSRPLCNQCSPDLIPRPDPPHREPRPRKGRLPTATTAPCQARAADAGANQTSRGEEPRGHRASVRRVRSSSPGRESAGRCKRGPRLRAGGEVEETEKQRR